eukprot:SAG31_NODE_9377_length_1288_cov_1.055509_2_plen_82_part_00
MRIRTRTACARPPCVSSSDVRHSPECAVVQNALNLARVLFSGMHSLQCPLPFLVLTTSSEAAEIGRLSTLRMTASCAWQRR